MTQVTDADREAELSKVIAELRALLTAATPGDLSTAERHIENETVECPACQGDGEIEAADYCNFDGLALGVQFYGIGREFGAHEKLWTATIKALPMLLDAADPTRHRTASTAALTAEIQRLREALERIGARDYGFDTPSSIARAALSTSSEVSEPVADTIGGVFADRPGMFDKPNPDEIAGTYSAFEVGEPEAIGGGEAEKEERAEHLRSEIRRCTVAIESGTADPWWYEDRGRFQQELDALLRIELLHRRHVHEVTPQPVSGDAVREALPEEIAKVVLEIGRAEWGQTHAHDADGHAAHIGDSVRMTAEHFGQTEPQHMHGVWIEGTETVICHTGTSPNSPKTARALTGAWNWLHDRALAALNHGGTQG